jgi:hypothetical protein
MAVSSNVKFGLPYQGSKSRIARQIVDLLPAAPCLVDAFAGGCAVTHAALLSGKFGQVIANDLSDAPELFYRAAKSGAPEKPRWISREEFFAKKDTDPLIRYVYSFGNACRNYLYGRDIEPLKHAAHMAVVDGDCSHLPDALRRPVETALAGVVGIRERYLAYKAAIRRLGKRVDLVHLECLARLQRLQRLQHLDRLTVSRRDYRDLHIPAEAVLYCDPPYASTAGYGAAFDHRAFYAWCRSVGKRFPLFVSEYWMPSDFRRVAEFEVRAIAGATTNAQTRIEKIFTI